ncbi:MAG: 3'(2'),5'-bisphosphate nucleotidase CysQ [Pseudomonadota bacterium]
MNTTVDHSDSALCDAFCDIALKAGAKIMAIYATDFTTEQKEDASPVTAADKAAEAIILAALEKIAPSLPVLAEERASEGDIPELGDEFILVDPLDGTREFINRTGEFTVNIALIRKQRPVLGVVYAPAINKLYAGLCGVGAWRSVIDKDGAPGMRDPIAAVRAPSDGLIAVASRSHRSPETDAYLETLNVADFAAAGSSLKFCLIAEGAAHLYPRFGRTMEWDTAAGQAVLEAAGGGVRSHPDGAPLRYGKKERDYDNPYFIAAGPAA